MTRGATAIVEAPTEPFGTVFGATMAVARFASGRWSAGELVPLDSFSLHPGTHALHYGSSCFEGLKAHRQPDGRVVPFRADVHVERLRQSAARLWLPTPPAQLVADLVAGTVEANETHCARSSGLAVPATDDARHGRDDRRSGVAQPGRRPLRAGLPRRRLPPAPQADGRRGDCRRRAPRRSSVSSRAAPTTPWRCRRSWPPARPVARTRCSSHPAVVSRRRERRTSCSSTVNTS